MKKECPKCELVVEGKREIKKWFGFRNVNGSERPQSYCKSCAKKSKQKSVKKSIVKKEVVVKNKLVKKEVKTKFYKTCNGEMTGNILTINKTELREMLERLEASRAQLIGVDIKLCD